MSKPRLTEKVLRGLTEAIARIGAGEDLGEAYDDDPEAISDYLRASEWVSQMWAYRRDKAAPR